MTVKSIRTRPRSEDAMRSLVLALTIALAVVLAASAADVRVRLAVTNLEPQGIDAPSAALITDRLRSELFATGKFTVLERGQMEAVLKEQGFQQSGCTSDECAVEVGQLLGVQYMVTGSIGKVGRTYTVNARAINVATAEIQASTNVDCQCEIDAVLTRSTKEVAGKIATSLGRQEKQEPTVETKPEAKAQTKPEPAVQAQPAAQEQATTHAREALPRPQKQRSKALRIALQVAGGALVVGGGVVGLIMNAKAQDDIDRATAIKNSATAATFEKSAADYDKANTDYGTHSTVRTISYIAAGVGAVAFGVSFAF
jgi:curli biogenesis system outer membrane secretion channel CsgG